MSLIKRWMEQEESANDLVAALKALLECDMIKDKASQGISKKIISDRSIDHLSSKQLNVYETYINPLLTQDCQGHCDGIIEMSDLPNAIYSEFENGSLLCQHCIYDNQRMKEQ